MSASYLTGEGIVFVSTLSLAATLIIVSVGSTVRTGLPTLGVTSPLKGSTEYVVVI